MSPVRATHEILTHSLRMTGREYLETLVSHNKPVLSKRKLCDEKGKNAKNSKILEFFELQEQLATLEAWGIFAVVPVVVI